MRVRSKLAGVLAVGVPAVLALAACASPDVASGNQAASGPRFEPSTPVSPPAPGPLLTGASIAMMAEQYARPRAGQPVATGASAWVGAAPPPALVVAVPLPPAGAEAPPPAAVANRQPAPSAAAGPVRPEAAAPEAPQPSAAADPALRTRGLALFNDWSCGTCHAMGDAGAAGAVGPSLDGNPRLAREFVVDVITDGRGAMPGFGGLLNEEEIAALSDYVMRFSRR